ncbi:hypothetical protein GLYMA_01G176500v4 [Glycine max]|nr:hypothetical protein GLYMA_01G176500v4 [Glycine max]
MMAQLWCTRAVVAWWLHWVVVAPPEWEQSENQGRST